MQKGFNLYTKNTNFNTILMEWLRGIWFTWNLILSMSSIKSNCQINKVNKTFWKTRRYDEWKMGWGRVSPTLLKTLGASFEIKPTWINRITTHTHTHTQNMQLLPCWPYNKVNTTQQCWRPSCIFKIRTWTMDDCHNPRGSCYVISSSRLQQRGKPHPDNAMKQEICCWEWQYRNKYLKALYSNWKEKQILNIMKERNGY